MPETSYFPNDIITNRSLHWALGSLWQYRLWSFQGKDTKLESFLPKNQLQSNEIILQIVLMGRCQKVLKFDFQSQFSTLKIIRIFLTFFH